MHQLAFAVHNLLYYISAELSLLIQVNLSLFIYTVTYEMDVF